MLKTVMIVLGLVLIQTSYVILAHPCQTATEPHYQSIVDISFDFYPPNPSVDYQSIKHLFTQLFQRDAHLLHLHDLTELVLTQSEAGVGTTVKTADGEESDPYAVLSVVNMGFHRVGERVSCAARERD